MHRPVLIQLCGALQIEKQQDNNKCLSYWLSNTVTLLYLLQKNIKPASGGTYTSRLRSSGPANGRCFPEPTSQHYPTASDLATHSCP